MRTQILNQAARLLENWGYAGTSMEDLAEAVGVTKKSLYHYFSSKDDLVFALSTRMLAEHATKMNQLHTSGRNARERLLLLIDWFSHPAPAPEVMRDVTRFLPESQQVALAHSFLEAVVVPIEAIIQEGILSGEFSPQSDPRLSAWMVLGALSSLSSLAAMRRSMPESERVLRMLTSGLSG